MKGFHFRRALRKDDAAVLDLFRASFGDRPLFSQEWWEWFSYRCPAGPNRTYLAEDSKTGELAGSYSLLPTELWLNIRPIPSLLCTNVNTHPDYRSRGIFTALGQYALAQDPGRVALGVPNENAVAGHRTVGWDTVCRLSFMVNQHNRDREDDCEEVPSFTDETRGHFDNFHNRLLSKYHFLVIKRAAFSDWRYAKPDTDYTKLVLMEGGMMTGYAVLKHFEEDDIRRSHIMDFQAENSQAASQILAACETRSRDSDSLSLWTNFNSPNTRWLAQAGFHHMTEGSSPLIIHPSVVYPAPGGWSFSLADNDVY